VTESPSIYVSKWWASSPEAEHHFFAWLAKSIVVLVFFGFARTYYLHSLFGMPTLTTFLHFHGSVMTGWIILFAVQTFLITSKRIPAHRILGAFGAGIPYLSFYGDYGSPGRSKTRSAGAF
jgi:hypothetical protein